MKLEPSKLLVSTYYFQQKVYLIHFKINLVHLPPASKTSKTRRAWKNNQLPGSWSNPLYLGRVHSCLSLCKKFTGLYTGIIPVFSRLNTGIFTGIFDKPFNTEDRRVWVLHSFIVLRTFNLSP